MQTLNSAGLSTEISCSKWDMWIMETTTWQLFKESSQVGNTSRLAVVLLRIKETF